MAGRFGRRAMDLRGRRARSTSGVLPMNSRDLIQDPRTRRRTSAAAGRPRRAARRDRPLRVESLEDRCLLATISGTVYQDLNNNGLFDAGEPTIANNPIELRNAVGTVINS